MDREVKKEIQGLGMACPEARFSRDPKCFAPGKPLIKHSMTGPVGWCEFCFPETLTVEVEG